MELKVTVTPPEIKDAPKHTCNVCGYYGIWTKNWWSKAIFMGKGLRGYEIYFKACSDVCKEKAEKEKLIEKFKKEKRVKSKRLKQK